jgi:hypothetical protein
MLGCIHPISSPMMKMMLGFCPCWAKAGALAIVVAVHNTARARQIFLDRLIVTLLNVWLLSTMSAVEARAAAFAQFHK